MLINKDNFDKQSIINLISKPAFIPEQTPVHTQMLRFKNEKISIGLVVDEYGDVQGLVTLDDLLQEIVGELITDDELAKKQSDGSHLIDALIVDFMETIPKSGISIKLHGHPLEIIKRDENAVKLVKFLPEK